MKIRPEIKMQAKANFQSQYGISVAALLLVMLITSTVPFIQNIINLQAMLLHGAGSIKYALTVLGTSSLLGQVSMGLAVFVFPPVIVGYNSFTLNIYRGFKDSVGGMFSRGFSNYWRKVGGMLWMELWVFLWSLLFIIPGIIKALSYFMAPYILADCPAVTATDALKLSMRMTDGHKGKVFVMGLSFIGWGILSGLTFGILGILYTGPYMSTSFAGLYDELKNNALANGAVRPEELGLQPAM